MATTTKIGRLTDRIDALAERRRGRLTLEDLTDQGRAKIKRGAAQAPVRDDPPDPVARADMLQWSTDALLRFLIDAGALDAGDFKRRPNERP
jgi:hypothetical protein